MIDTYTAESIVLQNAQRWQAEQVPLSAALGRVLAEDLSADRDFPPFDRVTMDGIAIDSRAYLAGQRAFRVAGIAPAGSEQVALHNPHDCLEVMTGAVLPLHADTVLRYEDLHIQDGRAMVMLAAISPGQNIHRQGSDQVRGATVLRAGQRIAAPEIGLAATLGKHQLLVRRLPRAVVIATGDELVPVEATPLAHQIRSSNVYQIQAALMQQGLPADTLHLADNKEDIREKLAPVLAQYDVVVLSGGVSAGKFDYLPEVLAELGVQQLFHKVAQRPGKPLWFGVSAAHGTCVFALPGNPISSFMCTQRYVLPWLHASLGLPPQLAHAVLAADVDFKPDLTFFLQVRVTYNAQGQAQAHPMPGNGSGDLASLTRADAFLELPRGRDYFAAGEVFRLIVFR